MHPQMKIRRARTTKPIEVAASLLRYMHVMRNGRDALLDPPYESHSFVWPTSYEEGLRRRTYAVIHPRCERADCGCVVRVDRLFVDPRCGSETICALHGSIVVCAECSQITGVQITPESEALAKKGRPFFCSDTCAENVA